ncbi:MAG: hypothetical protein KDE19_03365, partial [Caldilineaceae bacterium]|nr:hypothetical protein [Caldilineaceae bacterium]
MADAKTRVATKKGKEAASETAGSRGRTSNGRASNRVTQKGTTAKTTSRRSASTTKRTGTSTSRRTAPHLAEVQPSTKPRKVTMGRRTQTVSLRTDLQKFGDETYVPEDFVNGAQLIIDAGAGERLRDLVSSVLRSKGAFGNMQSEHVMEGLLDQLSTG